MQRNAAGELLKPHPSTHGHNSILSNASGNHSSSTLHVSGVNVSDASAAVHRFKLYFPTFPPSLQTDQSPSVQHRSSLTHVVVPYRGSLGDITLQWLADQAALRISKRYPQLVADFEVEGFDVVPLIFEPSSSGSLPQERRSGEGAIVVSPAPVPLSLTGWVHDSLSAYRLDLAMNGLDELDFYFSLPTHSYGFDHTAPPFELVLIWKPRDAPATSRRGSTPLLSNSALNATGSTGGSAAVSRGSNHRPLSQQASPPQPQHLPQLPPLVPQRSTTPSRLPALEPRRPNEGAPRHRQSSPSPLGTPPQNAGYSSPQVGSSDSVTAPTAATAAAPDAGLAPRPKHEIPAGSSERSFAAHDTGLALANDGNPSPPAHRDVVDDKESLQTRVDQPSLPPPPLLPPSEASKGLSSRRNQATFVEQDASSPPQSAGAPALARGLSSSPGGVNDGSSRSPMCESDSEMNPDEFFTFQFQLLVLTEAEDRETIVLTEARDRTVVIKEQQGERLLHCAARTVVPRIPLERASAMDDDDGEECHPRVREAEEGRSVKGGKLQLVQIVKQGYPSPTHAQGRADATESSPPSSLPVFTTVRENALRAPIDSTAATASTGAAAVSAASANHGDASTSSPDPKTARAAPVKHRGGPSATTSSSSVETAALFASAPTSRVVLEAMRSKDLDHVRRSDFHEGEVMDTAPASSDDDEARMLACDELMQDWFSLRHTVLTEERKEFRQLTQKAKQMQRILMSSMVNAICDEVVVESVKFGESSPRRGAAVAPESQLASPPFSLQRAGGGVDRGGTRLSMASSSLSASAATAMAAADEGAPRQRSTEPLSRGLTQCRPPAPPDDALIRLARIAMVSEEADRRELLDEESRVWAALVEGHMIHRKRVQLKLEQRYIAEERALLESERKIRAEIAEVEDRKFSMFAALCAKGILRIRASETQLDC